MAVQVLGGFATAEACRTVQRNHWYVYDVGAYSQVPLLTRRTFETDAVPDTTGATEIAGAGCAATPAAVETDHLTAEVPIEFVALTATLMNRDASAAVKLYVDDVAPEISVHVAGRAFAAAL